MATIQGIYIALFGRPADPAGLEFWMGETNNGADLSGLIGRLTAEPEALERFEGLANDQVVSLIYQSLFGRTPDAAGLEYFTELLESGEQSLETIAINILDGAKNDDAAVVVNKVQVADAFTESLDTQAEIDAYNGDDAADIARELISGVTSNPESIPTQEEIDETVEHVKTGEPPVDEPNAPNPPNPPADPVYDVSEQEVGTVATDINGNMFGGDGSNPATNFAFVTIDVDENDAPDIILGLGGQQRGGPAMFEPDADGDMDVSGGVTPALKWSVASSDGKSLADILSDFDIKLSVDPDGNAETDNSTTFTAVLDEDNGTIDWAFTDSTGLRYIDDDAGNSGVSQGIQALSYLLPDLEGELFSSPPSTLDVGSYVVTLALHERGEIDVIGSTTVSFDVFAAG